jgi:hypothetical protein
MFTNYGATGGPENSVKARLTSSLFTECNKSRKVGKLQRTRGQDFEREICAQLSEEFGFTVKRKLGQERDSGADIHIGNFVLECKRRRSIAVYEWLGQVIKAADAIDGPISHLIPAVIARADGEDALAVLRLIDFIKLMRGEIADAK